MKQATAFGILIPLALMVLSDALRTWGWAAAGVLLGVLTTCCAVVFGLAWWKLSRAIDATKGDQL